MNRDYYSLARASMDGAGVRDRLKSTPAVVLERIARGGGRTEWYYCSEPDALDVIAGAVSPGSVISFYFDGRICRMRNFALLTQEIAKTLVNEIDIVIGVLDGDGIRIHAQIVVGQEDLDEFVSELAPDSEVFFGKFPGRDNDGTRAITLTLPDRDGVIRPHPH
jgi:hypothetical protein